MKNLTNDIVVSIRREMFTRSVITPLCTKRTRAYSLWMVLRCDRWHQFPVMEISSSWNDRLKNRATPAVVSHEVLTAIQGTFHLNTEAAFKGTLIWEARRHLPGSALWDLARFKTGKLGIWNRDMYIFIHNHQRRGYTRVNAPSHLFPKHYRCKQTLLNPQRSHKTSWKWFEELPYSNSTKYHRNHHLWIVLRTNLGRNDWIHPIHETRYIFV